MVTTTIKTWMAIASIILSIGMFLPNVPALANTNSSQIQSKAEIVNLTGTIRKLAVEGTCYQLAANDGKNYEPIGKFPKRDGVKVQVSGVVVTDAVSICQVGQIFKVKSYRILK